MKIHNTLSLLIISILYVFTSQKTIPDNIVIPKSPNSKNIPINNFIPDELEPTLKVSPEIKLPSREFTLIELYKVLPSLYIDPKDSEYDGISLIAETLKADLARVIGGKIDEEGKALEDENGLNIITDRARLSGKAIIAGT
jgi:hypothetical protein